MMGEHIQCPLQSPTFISRLSCTCAASEKSLQLPEDCSSPLGMNLATSPARNIFSPKMQNLLSCLLIAGLAGCHSHWLQALIDFRVCFPTTWLFAVTQSQHSKPAALGEIQLSPALLLCEAGHCLGRKLQVLREEFSTSAQLTCWGRIILGCGAVPTL